jgi:ATP-dependent protease Clp ATPase subunit
MTDVMFNAPSDESIERVVLTVDTVKHGAEPLVFRKQSKSAS